MTEAELAHEGSIGPQHAGAAVDALPNADERLGRLLEKGLGLTPTPRTLEAFAEQAKLRARSLGIEENTYIRQLALGGPAARAEWMAVAPALVVGETFLFRDTNLWKLVETTLLPQLSKLARPIWMWSAGCSTGEEAYTLAIVAQRALGEGAARILATDVNPKAVAAARVGVYGQWSLRGVDADKRLGLTVNGTQTVRVHEDIKSTVRFEAHNLNDFNAYPPAGMQSFELVLCRNVLIYMTHAVRAKIVRALVGCVSPGGVLILGHGEATGMELNDLVLVERHDAAVVFRRPLHPFTVAPAAPKAVLPAKTKRRDLKIGRSKPQSKPRAKVEATKPETAAPPKERPLQAGVKAAMDLARHGELGKAERAAALAIAKDGLDPEPRVLLAAILMARGSLAEAEAELRRALFLDPVFVPALWQAGNLYGMTGRKRQAVFAFARALTQLEGLAPDAEALPFDNLTVGELTTLLRAELGERVEA